MHKEGHGTMCEFVEKKAALVIFIWYNNQRVITMFNFLGKDTISQANCFDRKRCKMIQVPHPAIVDVYNHFIGGTEIKLTCCCHFIAVR